MASKLCAALAASLAFAAPALADEQPGAGADPMGGWRPPVVKHEKKDRQEIEAMLKRMEAASQRGDLEAAAALVDFPVLMVTDDSKGEAGGEVWTRERWVEVMKPFYAKPSPPDAMKPGKRTIVLVSDSLALVGSAWTMKMGPHQVSGTSGLVLVRKAGEWKAKGMIEGGWGDAPMAGEAPAK